MYMAYGGTNFGFTAGGNKDKGKFIQPLITSYDYDAPINEYGTSTEKFKKLK